MRYYCGARGGGKSTTEVLVAIAYRLHLLKLTRDELLLSGKSTKDIDKDIKYLEQLLTIVKGEC